MLFLNDKKFIVQVFVLQRQIPTSIPGSLYIFLLFSLLDEKTFGLCETRVFCSVENALIEEAKKLSYQIDPKKKKNYGAFNDLM